MSKINLDSLILFNNIRQNEIIINAVKIFNEYFYREYITYMEADYYEIQRALLERTQNVQIKGNYWENLICSLLAESENKFSLMAEKGMVDDNIIRLAEKEISEIKKLYTLDWEDLSAVFHDAKTSVCCMKGQSKSYTDRDEIRLALEKKSNEDTIRDLEKYYQVNGCGLMEKFNAFRWEGELIGIKNYDNITFNQLIGYEKQKETLIENTDFFLKGYKSNNVLLYGDRGTGKSSCVKALLNKFKTEGLKIISLNKNHITDIYRVFETLSDRGCKFIIFIDDLSFEGNENEYKYFKSVIEGGIEAQPSNALIYVTSNRKNLIKESWLDRREDGGEVHFNDGMQERLSLSDRFGITITFISPDKNLFLDIVRGIAKQEKLDIEDELLTDQAMRWELRQKGRSGRSARQFINYMQAKNLSNLKI
ncbi:MAG: ATP-binding protein [Anaerovoracaceae bacterium]|jgi:predicted AAA+ superfamily ATPase